MFFLEPDKWKAIADFARNLGADECVICVAKNDLEELFAQLKKNQSDVKKKYNSKKLEKTLSWANLYFWVTNLYCFFALYLSGFYQAAIRELRFYLEASARSYHIDSRHQKTTYNYRVSMLREVRWKKFKELLHGLPNKKKKELKKLYDNLCEYVHLSKETQIDALRDPDLNLSLNYPYYQEEKEPASIC